MIHYYDYAFMCLLSCILLYLCDSDIYVIVIYNMCALYFVFIDMSYHLCYAHLLLLPHLYSDANELYYLYSCSFSYPLSTSCWLGSYKLA